MGCRTVASSTSTAPSPARSCARIRRSVSMSDSRGTRRATGLPCLVIVSGSWLSATASSSARHRCLNSPAATWPQPKIRSTHAPEPAAAPPEPLPVASRVPDSPRDDPFAELSPDPSSAAPLLHPQRQRELIEQAAGMSTRQVAGLLAGAAPEVVPPRDTLRAVAPDRCTLKVSIDQECEQGLRRLKGLLSHLDPRMSWGDLVARLVREAVARHDPRGGGSGPRRRAGSAGSAGASPRTPNKTCAAGAAAGPAQRGSESSGRAPNRPRAAGAPAQRAGGNSPAPQGNKTRPAAVPTGPAQRAGGNSPARQGNKTRPAAAPTGPAQRAGGNSPAPQGNNTRPAVAPTGPAQRAGGDSPAPPPEPPR